MQPDVGFEAAPAHAAPSSDMSVCAKLRSTEDQIEFECRAGESILEAALRAGIPIAHACGGKARCSTCRIWLHGPVREVPQPGPAEAALRNRLAFSEEIRLACQLRPVADLSFRRLVLDQNDLAVANQLDRIRPAQAGEIREVAVLFFDVADFTEMASHVPPYDVMFLLNKFLAEANRILERHGGYFDKTIGDGFLAVFGVRGMECSALRAVAAALEILAAVDRAKPVMDRLYGLDFGARIGLHYGEALIGALGPPTEERLTVIGDVANIASRVEQANKEAGTSLLITEELYQQVGDDVISPDFLRIALKGQVGRRTLYEVTGLTAAANEKIRKCTLRPSSDLPGRDWIRAMPSGQLAEGALAVIPQPRFDIAVTRQDGRVYAFNNNCPHNRLPFFGQEVPEGAGLPPTPAGSSFPAPNQISCRFHHSVFNLVDGQIVSWCPALAPDGTSPGLEILGDLSKNEAKLEVFRCREIGDDIWIEVY